MIRHASRSRGLPGQASLDFTPRARTDDPETSKEAAAKVGSTAQHHYAVILAALKARGPGTYHEIAGWTWLPPVSVGRRMGEMQRAGLVQRATYTRPSPAGLDCAVWQLADLSSTNEARPAGSGPTTSMGPSSARHAEDVGALSAAGTPGTRPAAAQTGSHPAAPVAVANPDPAGRAPSSAAAPQCTCDSVTADDPGAARIPCSVHFQPKES